MTNMIEADTSFNKLLLTIRFFHQFFEPLLMKLSKVDTVHNLGEAFVAKLQYVTATNRYNRIRVSEDGSV